MTTPVDQASANQALKAQVDSDRTTVEGILERWVPQIASSADGSTVPAYLLKFHMNVTNAQATYSRVVILQSSDFTSFRLRDHYVAVVAETFSSSDGALGWCRDHGRAVPDSCFAKIISRRLGPTDTTKTK